MSFKNVVVLGGGPIGLLTAIEAKKSFKSIVIVEKRKNYSRNNVPMLGPGLREHLSKIGVADQAGLQRSEDVAPLSRIEEALWKKAESLGVVMKREFVTVGIGGQNVKADNTFKTMKIVIKKVVVEMVDSPKGPRKEYVPKGPAELLDADLLIVSTGGGASKDPVLKDLGFEWDELKAKNYGAFGVFEPGDYAYVEGAPGSYNRSLGNSIGTHVKKFATGKTAFQTSDHNYLLLTLGGCTKTEFNVLKENAENLKTLLKSAGATMGGTMLTQLRAVDRNVELFKISVKKANQFYSPRYPAVLIGDAAVTPHPEDGTGLITGFKGLKELQILFDALKRTHRTENYRHHFLRFNDSFHLVAAEKALAGTLGILDNLRKTAKRVEAGLQTLLSKIQHAGARTIVSEGVNVLALLVQDLTEEMRDTEILREHLGSNPTTQPPPGLTVQSLWDRIAVTYQNLKDRSSQWDDLSGQLQAMELKLTGS